MCIELSCGTERRPGRGIWRERVVSEKETERVGGECLVEYGEGVFLSPGPGAALARLGGRTYKENPVTAQSAKTHSKRQPFYSCASKQMKFTPRGDIKGPQRRCMITTLNDDSLLMRAPDV